ncbi:aspartate aminotransferase family protein [Alkalibacillus haloalkaliphilus]|uniref:(S)-3-amino-2-methylpropionate transaminase n=1 Tax=Alkalibacillus haloalkaliphilus TaxID=94136 RepID=A0A511W483_9BACI|nr:aspartate aminotransferase family protein [Alkalibacillus haloalkaliphilus]GEN45905.1 aspartate aminotransferase family protein [Alkalibacillus haloalkaliphilus]
MHQDQSWVKLTESIGDYLAPGMAKDHPNLPVEKAEGCYYYGIDGEKYLDFTSGIAVENVGHRHPKVVQAIKDSADHLVHGPSGVIIYEPILKLAEQLQSVLPEPLDNFFFGNSGTEAIEGAIKLAKHATERPYVISFTGCFHGRTVGALSVSTSNSKYRKFLQPSWLTYQLPYADPSSCPVDEDPDVYFANQLEEAAESLFNHQVEAEEVACMIVEPVLGEGGYVIPPKGWLQKMREICDRHGILLIFDEVQTGFGRTGEWFAAQTFGVTPDIMAIAKGIAAGMPLSATVASKELMSKWPLGSHATTFGGNPIACAASIASLDVIKNENLIENTKDVGQYAFERLQKLAEKHGVIKDVRGVGLMIGIEMQSLGEQEVGDLVMDILNSCLQKGVLYYLCGQKGQVIRMIPPLVVTKEEIDFGLNVLDEVLTELTK